MSQQGLRQASVRAVTGTALTYEGDWLALFDQASVPGGMFNERLLRWINLKLSAAYTNLPEAQQALATSLGVYDWNSIGTFDADIGGVPENQVAPVASGTPTVGQTLSCSTGTWSGSPDSYAYQWLRDGVAIGGATTDEYLLTVDDFGADISCEVTATNGEGPGAPAESNALGPVEGIAAPFASVIGPTGDFFGGAKFEGWAVDYASQPTISSPVAFTVQRQGYEGTDSASANTIAAVTDIIDTFYVTKAVRQSWPNNASQSALTAALSDYIYSTDTPSGSVTNDSTLVSPKPVAKWALPQRRVVGNSIRLEVVAFHRDARAGKQVAGVVFTATDGTNTVTATRVTPEVLGYDGDQNAVIGYGIDLDITSLNDNDDFTVDAVVYPHIGASTASQRRSVDGTATNYWEFATQTYLKNTSRAASPPLAYVTAAGNDGTGVVSTTAATALATPFATVKGALEGLKAQVTTTDGCEIRISNTTAVWPATSVAAGTYQASGEVVITRDPAQAKASCIFSLGNANTASRQQWIKVRDLTVDRAGGTNQGILNTPGQMVFEDCDFNNSSRASQFIGSASVTTCWIGCAITNGTAQLLGSGTTPTGLVRGCTGATLGVEALCTIGNAFTSNTTVGISATRGAGNVVLAFNKFFGITATTFISVAVNTDGFAICQNVLEFTSTTANPTLRLSADAPASNNLTHIVVHNNTLAGSAGAGRCNIFYDETTGSLRTHKLNSYKGNLTVADYYKSDIFHANSGGEGFNAGNPSTFIGSWSFNYGVGCAGNFSNYGTSNPLTEGQDYAGAGSLVGNSVNTPLIGPAATMANLFTANAAVTWNGSVFSAGAGNGTYTVVAGASLLGILADPVLAYTLDGVARASSNDNPGALSVAA